MDKIELYSTTRFLEECLNNNIMISDLHDFIEKKTDYDIEKLTLLKHSFYQFKLKIIEEKLPEIKESDLYKSFEGKEERIPMMTSLSRITKEEIIQDRDKTTTVVYNELDEFIETFLFIDFVYFDRAKAILDEIIENHGKEKEALPHNSELKFLGNEIEFTELVKALIEAKMIQGKNQKAIFEGLGNFLNVPKFDKTDKLRFIKKRSKEIAPFLNNLEDKLISWTLKKF